MRQLKGFVTFPSFTDNEPGKVSKIGELSANSLTFSSTLGIYKNPKFNDVLFYCFYASEEEEVKITPSDSNVELATRIGRRFIEWNRDELIPDNIEELIPQIEFEFGLRLSNVRVGEWAVKEGVKIPSRIIFNDRRDNTEITLWFSDDHFSVEFFEYEQRFVSPLENLDDLIDNPEKVVEEMSDFDTVDFINRISVTRNTSPYTKLTAEKFDWFNPTIPGHKISLPWGLILYGVRGGHPLLVLEGLRNWILENSVHPVEVWSDVLPDVFKPNEFIMIPHWYFKNCESGYGSTLSVSILQEVLGKYVVGINYTNNSRLSNTQISPFYKNGLMLSITGANSNRNNRVRIQSLYHDFTYIEPEDNDFTHLSETTRNFIIFLKEFIELSKTDRTLLDNDSLGIPLERNGNYYLATIYEDFIYMTPFKDSVDNDFGKRWEFLPDRVVEDC